MQQPEDGDLNPYAAPRSDVTPPRETEAPMKRPASTKWAIAVALFFLLGYAVTWQNAVRDGHSEEISLSALESLDLLLRLTCFLSLVTGKAKPWGYYMSGVSLTLLWLMGIRNIWLSAIHLPEKVDVELLIEGGIFLCLFNYLLLRFVFGQPSRRFYRVLSD